MPLINITILQGRTEEQVKQLIQNVTVTVSETLGAPKESIRVLVHEMPKTHWGIAGTPVSDIPGR
ncbi:4-oxalocrotonate tautomerase [Ammoniphilus sp. 3BR4]|uniref:4-oxalocrotonate tautomerase n=1 Tax=Ammoniphilus sp. 3BR4 TaxID=3158265 RepID=UPI003465B5B3